MSTNLQNLTANLRSSKATDRTNALESLRETFKRDKIVLSLNASDWLVVYNALFDAFGAEKTASLKSGNLPTGGTGVGAAAVRRLRSVAETIRWMTERSVERITRKVVGALISHFLSHLNLRGGLFEPVALSYIKALHCLVGFRPHLEHMEAVTWIKLVEMSFNAVLGLSLRQPFDPKADDWAEEPAQDVTESGPDAQSEEEYSDTPPTPRRKRQRGKPMRNPTPASREATPRAQEVHAVSHEQREFMALLAALLRDSYAPILSKDNPHLPGAILHRLRLVLSKYPGESSLYHDYLAALSVTLSRLSINQQSLVHKFAVATWDGLIGMWGSKSNRSKEDLVVVLRSLFPYLTFEFGLGDISPRPSYCDELTHLWKLLGTEAERRGVEGLSLDLVRLCIQDRDDLEGSPAFVTKTFRPSWDFDVGQSLTWATLDLQAECAQKLYLYSESVHAIGDAESRGKRTRLENPIASLLSSIQTQTSSTVLTYHLQSLLFIIDHHWSILHLALQQDVMNTLLQFLSVDDALVQSWTFMCFAAIAHAEGVQAKQASSSSSQQSPRLDISTWNTIWTHAMRRSTVPAVSRAACHAAHALLLHSKVLLTPQRVFEELETFAKDLDVQGPPFPYDAVCVFLVLCMQVASRDVRLYRMQFEEKVLTWFTDAWRPSGFSRSKMAPHTVEDLVTLLASICGVPKSAHLLSSFVLPDSPIVHAMVEQYDLVVIRDFLLHTQLPKHSSAQARFAKALSDSPTSVLSQGPIGDRDLVQPRPRERRASAYLLKSLEDTLREWESSRTLTNRPTAAKARSSLDLAIIAVFFEAILLTNGTSSNRRVLQAACKILRVITPMVADRRWTVDERLLIAKAFEPLIMAEVSESLVPRWVAFLPPGPNSGIRSDLLTPAKQRSQQTSGCRVTARRFLQRAALRSSDVQDVVPDILEAFRRLLRMTLGHVSDVQDSHAMDIDEADGFGGPSSLGAFSSSSYSGSTIVPRVVDATINISLSTLSVLPVLQSSSGEPTRDKSLVELILNCDGEDLLILGPALLRNMQQRTLNFSPLNFGELLEKLGDMLKEYQWSRSERLMTFIINLLHSSMHIWLPKGVAESDVGDHVRTLCHWLVDVLSKYEGGAKSWSCRDSLVRFLHKYLERDPSEEVWTDFGQSDVEASPISLLPNFAQDEDVRVRFRAAIANAHTLSPALLLGRDPSERYLRMRESLSVEVDEYESIITRLICLGNVIVVSSAVRRGAYWHLLEACLHSSQYTTHTENVLSAAASRLGLSSFSQLFESYASQIAYSIRQDQQDFLRLPAHLLGYKDRRECAEHTFHAFTPTNILANGPPNIVEHGRRLFLSHCAAIQKVPSEGIRDCFSEIIGYQIVWWIGEDGLLGDSLGDELEQLLRTRAKEVGEGEDYDTLMRQHADGVIATILSTLMDQDFTRDGPIVTSLDVLGSGEPVIRAFRAMSRYRKLDDFIFHQPNLPVFNTAAILQALSWFRTHVPSVDQTATTYHVLHKLFAEIDRYPLVNEQLRLLNAICLWVSLHQNDCEDENVLRVLMHGATSLLAQSDLTRAAQSILEWAFTKYGEVSNREDPRFAETLIRVSCVAYDFSCSQEENLAAMGYDLLRWAESRVLKLHKYKTLKHSIYQALSAWPREIPSALQSIHNDMSHQDLSTILSDNIISSNKFRLVRRLRDLAANSQYDDTQFGGSDFWRLKECIPPSDQLSDNDLDAFCELLFLQRGSINGLGSDKPTLPLVREKHIKGIKDNASSTRSLSEDFLAPQKAIVVTLLAILNHSSLKHANLAYKTLRSLIFDSQIEPTSSAWPSRIQGELSLLQNYPRSSHPPPLHDLEALLDDPSYRDMATDFHAWITTIASLLNDMLASNIPFYVPLSFMTHSDPKFSEDVLPVLVHTILQEERSNPPNGSPIRDCISRYFSNVLMSENTALACRRSIVDIVLHLRQFSPSKSDALAYDKWLDINFLLLSENAISCGAYTTALLFLELASDYGQIADKGLSSTEKILFTIYSHIDEPDGFYGINTTDLKGFLLKRFHHEKQWEKAFQFHGAGAEIRPNDSADTEGVLLALHSYGFDNLAMSSLHDIAGSQAGQQMSFELGWRTETWDLPERSDNSDFGAPLYLALRAINRERDLGAINRTIRRVLVQVAEHFQSLGNENVTEIRQVTQNLMCLYQVKSWQSNAVDHTSQPRNIVSTGLPEMPVISENFDFEDLETIMATRMSLLRFARQKMQREQIGDMVSPLTQLFINTEISCLLRLSRAAREANHPQIALNSVIRAQRLSSEVTREVSQEFANVLWLTKEPKIAVQYLRTIVPCIERQDTGDTESRIQRALLLSQLGTWTSQACLDRPSNISSQYFSPASKLAKEISDASSSFASRQADIFHSYATFAERQYHALVKSPDALRWKLYVDRKTHELSERRQILMNTSVSNADRQAFEKAQRVLEQDRKMYEGLNQTRFTFLAQAIEMLSFTLETSDTYDDDAPIRLCSLWFANFDYIGENFPQKVGEALGRVSSRKFVFLAHQLTSRMSKNEAGSPLASRDHLRVLVLRMCREHPFHTLYPVYCLQSDHVSSQNPQALSRRHSKRLDSQSSSQIDRAEAALDIFNKLRNDKQCGKKVQDIQILCAASLQWARLPIKSWVTRSNIPYAIPQNMNILNIKSFPVPVITARTAIDPTCKYENCVWIESFETSFTTLGGQNLPKVHFCVGSDGQRYKQLYKGEGGDDIRQDAVMEQVFALVNVVLRHDRETKRRKLHFRDYKVIPLAPQAGVLQFVENTTPLSQWLPSAHRRYRPQDMSSDTFAKAMRAAQDKHKRDSSAMTAWFAEYQRNIQPIMRYFFTEKHKTPMSWFRMRLNYSRSVAVTSIVGHILGLGDRHTSNILLDNGTGEVVHIDLGIAFEQGTMLRVPERVPFRLTQNMVDGLGTSGTQGVFQRCAEETLRVLRDGSEVILTVLEVFKYDPLHSWTASEVKVKKAQQNTSDGGGQVTEEVLRLIGIEANTIGGSAEAADRALSAVSRKLEKTLTIEFTVNELIAEATDKGNLSLMYTGWQPYL